VRWTIVGVVANERFHGLTNDVPIAAYMPLAQAPSRGGQSLLVRTAGDPGALAGAVRGAIREIDPALAVYGVEPLTATLADSFGTRRFVMLLLMLFAALAMLLAAVGVHGVLSYTVSQRTREIGVRMAMGASPRSVVRLVLGEGAKLIVLGLGTGLVLGVAFTRALGGLLYGVTSTDPLTFLAVGVLLAVVAGVSSYIPARRAMRVDPIVALRE
jgi:putative ABC transport system permease protein